MRIIILTILCFLTFNSIQALTFENTEKKTYSIKIHYPSGQSRIINNAVNHRLDYEKNVSFMTILVKDGRRFFITIGNKDFEFSNELKDILEEEIARNNAPSAADQEKKD
jgi:hypothetical protein